MCEAVMGILTDPSMCAYLPDNMIINSKKNNLVIECKMSL